MPSACQPSKKSASSWMQRRYFSAALSRSPTATSPLASSKISSGVAIDLFSHKDHNSHQEIPTATFKATIASSPFVYSVGALSFLELQAGCLLSVAQPFDEYNAFLVLKDSLFEGDFLVSGIRVGKRFSFFQNRNESVGTRGHKVSNVARVQKCHSIFYSKQLRRLILRLLGIRFLLFF